MYLFKIFVVKNGMLSSRPHAIPINNQNERYLEYMDNIYDHFLSGGKMVVLLKFKAICYIMQSTQAKNML